MSDIRSDLATFHRFIAEQLASGAELTTEECLRAWRAQPPTPEELRDSVAAVERALEQAARGEEVPWEDFDRDFRARHGIPRNR